MSNKLNENLKNKNSKIVFKVFTELAETLQYSQLIVIYDNDFAPENHQVIKSKGDKIIKM